APGRHARGGRRAPRGGGSELALGARSEGILRVGAGSPRSAPASQRRVVSRVSVAEKSGSASFHERLAALSRRLAHAAIWIVWSAALVVPASPGRQASRSPSYRVPTYSDHTRLLVVRDSQGREFPVDGVADWDVRRDHILAHFQEVAGNLPGAERRVPLQM